MKLTYFLLATLVIFDSCIDRLEVPSVRTDRRFIVDGTMTDKAGPYTVRLSLSSNRQDDITSPEPVADAQLQITDDLGNVEELIHEGNGIYLTSENFVGVPGRTYKLTIQASDGSTYESIPAMLTPAAEIGSVFQEFRFNSVNLTDLTKSQDAFFFFTNGRADSPEARLLRWRWKAAYMVRTFPHLKTRYDPALKVFVPDPLPCSGYFVDENGNLVTNGEECTCCDCWPTDYQNTVTISDPTSVSGTEFKKVHLGYIALDDKYFFDKLVFYVEQLTLSPEVHNFWHLVQTQRETAENIFQPNVVKVRGNIVSITNPDEEVFGVFSVSGVAAKKIELRLEDIPRRIPPLDTVATDCQSYSGGINQPPFFW